MTQKRWLCGDAAFVFGEKGLWTNQIRESFPITVDEVVSEYNHL